MLTIFFFLLGTVVGSFANVCIYRMPRNLSILLPSSRCPSCGTPIRFYDNIPILSYLILRGRCRNCGWRIPIRYPLVEFLNGVCFVAVFMRYGLTPEGLFFMAFFTALIVITFIDLDFQIIPDRITLPGTAVGLLAGGLFLPDCFQRGLPLGWVQSLVGALVGFGVFYLIAVVSRGGMGGGDIKMMAMVGAVTGFKGVFLTTFLGSLTGSFVGIGLMAFKGKGRKTKIPFGPFLALGAAVTILFGEEILRWYFGA